MGKEYKTEELKAVWGALLEVYRVKRAGCTAADIAPAAGLSEEVVRACLEYLKQDGKVEGAGAIYAPDRRYVRDVTITYAAEEVYKYLDGRRAGAAVDDIVAGIKNEGGSSIRRDVVEKALQYLEQKGKVVEVVPLGRWYTKRMYHSI